MNRSDKLRYFDRDSERLVDHDWSSFVLFFLLIGFFFESLFMLSIDYSFTSDNIFGDFQLFCSFVING